jgi:hypothetical protein
LYYCIIFFQELFYVSTQHWRAEIIFLATECVTLAGIIPFESIIFVPYGAGIDTAAEN